LLEYDEVASYDWLSDFELLKHSRHDISKKPWAIRSFREVAIKHFKVVHASEEIYCLNIEIRRLHKWIDDEDSLLSDTVKQTAHANPLLVTEVKQLAATRNRVNDCHRRRLQSIY
jgi:hypothetical protein